MTDLINENDMPNEQMMPSVIKFCQFMAKSKLLPAYLQSTKDHDSTPDLYMIAGMGHGLGLNFYQAINSIYVINGCLPALYVRAKRAIVLAHGGKFIEEAFDEGVGAKCVIERDGVKYTGTFTWLDAVARGKVYWDDKAKCYKGYNSPSGRPTPWTNEFRLMMENRACGRACDKAYADVLLGLGSAEDLQDMATNPTAPVTVKAEKPIVYPLPEENKKAMNKIQEDLQGLLLTPKGNEPKAVSIVVEDN